jgi:hypothetical protein
MVGARERVTADQEVGGFESPGCTNKFKSLDRNCRSVASQNPASGKRMGSGAGMIVAGALELKLDRPGHRLQVI